MTYFMARSNLVPDASVWEKQKQWILQELSYTLLMKLSSLVHSDKRYLLTSKFCPRGFSPLPRGSVRCLHFSNIFSEATEPIKAILYMEPPWIAGTKVCSHGLFHPTKRPPCPYLIKRTCIFFLLRNQWVSGHGTWYVAWYVASGTLAYLNKLTWWPWFDHDLLYGKVKFGPLCFSMGKSKIIGLFKNYHGASCETSVGHSDKRYLLT